LKGLVMKEYQVVGVRLPPDEFEQLERLMEARGCSKSEAMRLALSFGIPLALQATGVNVRRFATALEFLVASMGIIIRREHPDHEAEVRELVLERLEEFHA
jgi:hypothetical protein